MNFLKTNTAKSLLSAILLLAAFSASAATTYTSKANGNWTSLTTWTVSGTGSPVKYIISTGHTVTVNTYSLGIDSLQVYGALVISNSVQMQLNNNARIDVYKNGTISGGNSMSYFRFNNASTSSSIYGPFNGSSQVNGPMYATKNTTGFIGTPTALPVEILSFNATEENRTVVLSWETATEINNERFDIQRSSNGSSWETIGTVAGNGTSNDVNSYSYTDETPAFGSNSYRFVQVDYNGESSTSPERSVMLVKSSNRSDINTYPNPANSELNVTIENRDFMNRTNSVISIVNNMGQHFDVTVTETLGNISIDTQSLPEGLYSLTVVSAGDTYSKNIMIKH